MIRLAEETDARGILAIYTPIVTETAISFEWEAPSEAELKRRIKETNQSYVWLVAEEQREIAGYAYASAFRTREAYAWIAEVTVYVDRAWRRRGLASQLYGALFHVLRRLNVCTAIAIIALPNNASITLHQKFGFEAAGVVKRAGYKFGSWHDISLWQLELLSPPSPAMPRLTLAGLPDLQVPQTEA